MLIIPDTCPICTYSLVRVNAQIFCKNDACDAKSSKMIMHFIKVMKIKGLGEKTLEKLSITDITQLYDISQPSLVSKLGDKIGTKIFKEINQSRNVPLSTFIQSFGITLIGNSASTKLAKHTTSIWDIDKGVCKKAGLGEKATHNLITWIVTHALKYCDMPITTSIEINTEIEEVLKVVITGKLEDYTSRTKAKEFLVTKGVTVMSGVSKKVNYLVTDITNPTGSSVTKAHNLGIPIVSMNDLLNIINGEN